MKIEQRKWTPALDWKQLSQVDFPTPPQIVFVFGSTELVKNSQHYNEIKALYPQSHILMCSAAGEITDTEVLDDSLVVAAVLFEKTELRFVQSEVAESSMEASFNAGKELSDKLEKDGLAHVMVFSDGLQVIGTSLVQGIVATLPKTISVTGGLAGHGTNINETLLGLDEPPIVGKVVAIGFYGEQLTVGYGSLGGWDTFGPERLITKSKENVLYEVDNQNALLLYKEYLGEQAKNLPTSGLLFPLSLRIKNADGQEVEVVRSMLAMNEADQSMIFAGEMPEGIYAKLMKANFEHLIDGAAGAAKMSLETLAGKPPELAILISCVGRKLVLKERIEDETEAVRSILGDQTEMTGFYSYGEICPATATEKQCQLLNQTMTITTFRET